VGFLCCCYRCCYWLLLLLSLLLLAVAVTVAVAVAVTVASCFVFKVSHPSLVASLLMINKTIGAFTRHALSRHAPRITGVRTAAITSSTSLMPLLESDVVGGHGRLAGTTENAWSGEHQYEIRTRGGMISARAKTCDDDYRDIQI
jgi:hypothetical protein